MIVGQHLIAIFLFKFSFAAVFVNFYYNSTILLLLVSDILTTFSNIIFGLIFRFFYLPFSPERGDLNAVNNLEDALIPVHPVDVVAVLGRLQQQLLQSINQSINF